MDAWSVTAQSALDADGGTEISIRSEDGNLGTKNSQHSRLASGHLSQDVIKDGWKNLDTKDVGVKEWR